MGEGLHLHGVHIGGDVLALALFGKDQGAAEDIAHQGGDGDAGGLDGQHLGDRFPGVEPFQLQGHLIEKGGVYLVVEKAVHFQYPSRQHFAVGEDALLQKFHAQSSKKNSRLDSSAKVPPWQDEKSPFQGIFVISCKMAWAQRRPSTAAEVMPPA